MGTVHALYLFELYNFKPLRAKIPELPLLTIAATVGYRIPQKRLYLESDNRLKLLFL
nr:MAG TPA: hypothetical protein [Caudoviricetes sp.]